MQVKTSFREDVSAARKKDDRIPNQSKIDNRDPAGTLPTAKRESLAVERQGPGGYLFAANGPGSPVRAMACKVPGMAWPWAPDREDWLSG